MATLKGENTGASDEALYREHLERMLASQESRAREHPNGEPIFLSLLPPHTTDDGASAGNLVARNPAILEGDAPVPHWISFGRRCRPLEFLHLVI